MNKEERVMKSDASAAHKAGTITFGAPDRVASIRGEANGVRVTATLSPAARHMQTRAGLACTRLGGRKSVTTRRPRPIAAPAKNKGNMKPPCPFGYEGDNVQRPRAEGQA